MEEVIHESARVRKNNQWRGTELRNDTKDKDIAAQIGKFFFRYYFILLVNHHRISLFANELIVLSIQLNCIKFTTNVRAT